MLNPTQPISRARLSIPNFVYAFIQFIGQTSILIALGALGITCASAVLLGKQPTWEMALLPFLCTYCVYNFDRLSDKSGADQQSTPQRTAAIKRCQRWMKISVIAAFLSMIGLALSGGLLTLLITLAFPLTGMLYVLPILPFHQIKRLKDIPLLKSFYVPACWCLLVVLALHLGQIDWFQPATLFIFAFVYLRIFLGASIGDIRDLDADRAVGVQTLTGFLGLARSHRMVTALHLFSPILVITAVWAAWVPVTALGLIAPCLFGFWVYKLFCAQPENREFLGYFYDIEYISYFLLA